MATTAELVDELAWLSTSNMMETELMEKVSTSSSIPMSSLLASSEAVLVEG